jgi:hypothetical protein
MKLNEAGWSAPQRTYYLHGKPIREQSARFRSAAIPIAMKNKVLALFALLAVAASPLVAQDPEPGALESYVLGVGQNSDGVTTALTDKYFGGGTARAAIFYYDRNYRQNPEAESGVLILNVSRFVRPDEIVFALLVFEIEVRGYDAEGTQVYSKDLDGFTFGDSRSGRYSKVLRDLPLAISKLEVTFRGNYE